jgi:hypothetical protein
MLLRIVGTRLHLVVTHKITIQQHRYPCLEYKPISSLIISPAAEAIVLDVQNCRPQYELDTESLPRSA